MCSTADPPSRVPVPLEQLEQQICELAAHIAAATCRWLLLVAELDQRRGWADWGSCSCAHWLSWRCSLAPNAARERVRVARRLTELQRVREAFAAGELSYCKVRALTRVATEETEEYLVELARHATGAQLEKVVRGYRGALAATPEAAEEAHARRYLRWSWNDDGLLQVQARIAADDGVLLLAALRAAERMPAESADARDADALVSVARTALSAGSGDGRGAAPAEVVVHVDAESLAADQVGSRSEIADGPALAPETVRRLACDAAVVRIVEREGQPLSVGRRTRTIPPALRRALRARDGGCAFPGCTHRRFLHAHHIHHWARGGDTSLENLVHLCSHHHRLVHEGRFGVERAGPRSIRFRRPDGKLIVPHCPGSAARGPGIVEQHRACGPVVDADSCRALSAGDRIDYGIAVEALLLTARAGPPR